MSAFNDRDDLPHLAVRTHLVNDNGEIGSGFLLAVLLRVHLVVQGQTHLDIVFLNARGCSLDIKSVGVEDVIDLVQKSVLAFHH